MKLFSRALVVLTTSLAAFSAPAQAGCSNAPEPLEFDRLDGKGPSGVKVDVVDWEGNWEVHVYPKGALEGLGLKLLKKKPGERGDSVMVTQYCFRGVNYRIIRRPAITVPMVENFKTFIDRTDPDMDKVIVSGNTLSGVQPFALAPAPTQLFPDHYGTKEAAVADAQQLKQLEEKAKENRPSDANPDLPVGFKPKPKKTVDEDGAIQNTWY